MPPKKKDENMFETILEKLEALAAGRSEDKVKLDAILTETPSYRARSRTLENKLKSSRKIFKLLTKLL